VLSLGSFWASMDGSLLGGLWQAIRAKSALSGKKRATFTINVGIIRQGVPGSMM